MEAAEFSPYTCQSCGESCGNAGALTKHMRSHNSVSGGDRGILSMLMTSEEQKQRSINTEVAFLMKDMIKKLEDDEKKAAGPKKAKVGMRCRNKGSIRRKARSAAFKKSVIKEYEMLQDKYPGLKTQISEITADSFDITRDQVNLYVRKKVEIFKQAKAKSEGRKSRRRSKKGRFHTQEQQLYRDFKEHRKKGKRIGPRWLRRSMKKLVKEISFQSDLTRTFTSKHAWLHRCQWGK